MADDKKPRQRSRVPSGRLERLARIGWMAGEVAVGGAAESLKRVLGGGEGEGNPFLTGGNAERLASRLSTMRGAAMKLGQLISLEGDDFLPAEFSDALAVLRADGDAMPEKQLRRILDRAYGEDWNSRFAEFDFEPIAAASIGQVHRATTRDGRELALKIRYPGVANSIDSDVDNLATALQFARVLPGEIDFTDILEEAKRQLHDESDYELEADHLAHYGSLFAGDPDVEVPGVHLDLTTRNILAMDYLPGAPLEDLCGFEHEQADRDRVGGLLMHFVLRELFEFHFVQSDPNFANFLLLADGRLGLIDLGAAQNVSDELAQGYAELVHAGSRGDAAHLERAAFSLGFLKDGDDPAMVGSFLDLLRVILEPLIEEGVYDFGETDLAARAREAGLRMFLEHGLVRPPPAETIFIQRKLGGTFLLCARLKARVDMHALLAPVLAAVPPKLGS
jgi:predicted unusual protein kinase regulating ubiquinone biosynthesis (AarF/ABC1/UbiB family)